MAGNAQKNSRARVVPGLDAGSAQGSRVSKAADVQTPRKELKERKEKLQQTSVEQRSNLPSSRGGRSPAASARATPRPRQGASGASPKKISPSRATVNINRPPTSLAKPPADPLDIGWRHLPSWLIDRWLSLDARQQQRVFSLTLLAVSLLLFLSLTIFRTQPFFGWLNRFFLAFFGWSSYLLVLGLIAFAFAQFVESLGDKEFVRWSMIFGLATLWLLLLLEGRLIMGPLSAGALAEALVTPLLGWGPIVHVIMIGLILVTIVTTFRITFGHVLLAAHALQRIFSDPPRSPLEKSATSSLSSFLGQRPQYSRYMASVGKARAVAVPDPQPPATSKRRSLADVLEEKDEKGNISFDANFPVDDEDDPANDINLHARQVGKVPRGAHPPTSLDPAEHRQAVHGAQQQALSFNEPPSSTGEDKGNGKMILKGPPDTPMHSKTLLPERALPAHLNASKYEMEPLPPNPRHTNAEPLLSKPRGGKRAKAQEQAQVQIVQQSTWKLPELSLLSSPDTARIQMYNEDTEALAKLIQDTLRSFRVEAEVRPSDISIGPTIIRFGIRPTGKPEMIKDETTGKRVPVRDASGQIVYESRTRVTRIMALQNDLALVLEAKTIRMEAPVPGRPYVGVEIPNKNSRLVTLREVLESKEYEPAKKKSRLSMALGKDVAGLVRIGDLARMPHLLIAGATGAGKCLAYDEPIFLADGRVVKVQDLVGQYAEVIGVTDTQTMEQVPVQATFTENGVQEVFEIELDNGVILRRTGEHPLWAASLDENQHVGHQPNGKALRRTRAINAGWVHTKDLRVCGNRPHFDGHVILCPHILKQLGPIAHICLHSNEREALAPNGCQLVVSPHKVKRIGSTVKTEKLERAVVEQARQRELAATEWNAWRRARPLIGQKFADCPSGYEWRKIVAIRRITAPTVNIEVHSDNHAFVGYAVEHNSVMINVIIGSVLTQATPDDVRMLMVDPKMVELNMYNGIPHLLSPVVIEVDKVVSLLKNAITEMERRYRLFSQLGVRNLDGYRKLRAEKQAQGDTSLNNLPAIVIIIDELADLMMAAPEEVEGMICRLAQLARATGIHLVIATQRPSVDVITGLIKANIPTRISFMVSSAVDSRTIIDMGGAERLLGRGDMLYLPADAGRPERIQGAFLSDEEAHALADYWRQQIIERATLLGEDPQQAAAEDGWELKTTPSEDEELEDDLLDRVEEIVRKQGRASISFLQRRLRISYSRAARLIGLLEDRGIIGQSGTRARDAYDGDSSNAGYHRHEEGHSLADEVTDIVAEERARDEFLRSQAARFRQQDQKGNVPPSDHS